MIILEHLFIPKIIFIVQQNICIFICKIILLEHCFQNNFQFLKLEQLFHTYKANGLNFILKLFQLKDHRSILNCDIILKI